MSKRIVALLVFSSVFGVLGCEEPARKPLAPGRASRAGEERRAHAVTTPGPVGNANGSAFFLELQKDRPDGESKRPVLVEEDARKREVGFAFLSAPARLAFVDADVVVVATTYEVICYDARRHETRWTHSFADVGKQVDDFARRGDKLDVTLEGSLGETISIETGRKVVP